MANSLDDLISRIRSFVCLPAPGTTAVHVFATWMRVKQPLFTSELAFLDHSSDFITLAEGQDRGWLDGIVESVVAWCASGSMLQVDFPAILSTTELTCSQYLVMSPKRRQKSDERYIRLVTKYHVESIVRLILTSTIVALLMLPSGILYILPGHRALKFALVVIFTLLFSSTSTIFTKA